MVPVVQLADGRGFNGDRSDVSAPAGLRRKQRFPRVEYKNGHFHKKITFSRKNCGFKMLDGRKPASVHVNDRLDHHAAVSRQLVHSPVGGPPLADPGSGPPEQAVAPGSPQAGAGGATFRLLKGRVLSWGQAGGSTMLPWTTSSSSSSSSSSQWAAIVSTPHWGPQERGPIGPPRGGGVDTPATNAAAAAAWPCWTVGGDGGTPRRDDLDEHGYLGPRAVGLFSSPGGREVLLWGPEASGFRGYYNTRCGGRLYQ